MAVLKEQALNRRSTNCLALNGALLMLAGLLADAAIPAVPYPRLMLDAHGAGFADSGLISMLAALAAEHFAVFSFAARAKRGHLGAPRAVAAEPVGSRAGVLGNHL